MTAWIGEKITVASDESYRDPTNLQGKLQKHQAFEAELIANSERVNAVEMVQTFSKCIGTYVHAYMDIQILQCNL